MRAVGRAGSHAKLHGVLALSSKRSATISTSYKHPPLILDASGSPRLVGFELEFTGISLRRTTDVVLDVLGGEITEGTKAQKTISAPGFGEFKIELDWEFLKREAAESEGAPHVALLRDAASLIVPIEIVCPPLEIEELPRLDPLLTRLREAGARGTDDSPVAAYGLHINTSLPAVDPITIDSYLKAFCLLQWWLVRAHDVNFSRRLTPFINLYPDAYLKTVIEGPSPVLEQIIDTYLEHNATRNRGLDMLPLFMHLDAGRVSAAIDDPRIKSRPAFHYRLPDCLIGSPGWNLHRPWNLWCVIEELANRPTELQDLSRDFMEAWRPLIGVDQSHWIERIETWARNAGLA